MASIGARGIVMTRTSEVEDRMSCSSESISVFNGILEERSLGIRCYLEPVSFPLDTNQLLLGSVQTLGS